MPIECSKLLMKKNETLVTYYISRDVAEVPYLVDSFGAKVMLWRRDYRAMPAHGQYTHSVVPAFYNTLLCVLSSHFA